MHTMRSTNTKRFGKDRHGKQRYRCNKCLSTFSNKRRKSTTLLEQYIFGKQTYKQLGLNPRTIQKEI